QTTCLMLRNPPPDVPNAEAVQHLAVAVEILARPVAELISGETVRIPPHCEGGVEPLLDGDPDWLELETELVECVETRGEQDIVRQSDEAMVEDDVSIRRRMRADLE